MDKNVETREGIREETREGIREETRVGYVTTTFLEKLIGDHIAAFTVRNVYVGDPHYLTVQDDLQKYNRARADD